MHWLQSQPHANNRFFRLVKSWLQSTHASFLIVECVAYGLSAVTVSLHYRDVAQPGILFGRRQPPDVRSTVPSVYFRIVEIDVKHQRKILTIVFRQHCACLFGLIVASFCATDAEKIKHFVNVYLHCIVSVLKEISNMTTWTALKKFLRTPIVGSCSSWQLFGCQVGTCQLTVVLEPLNQICLMTVLLKLSNFLAYNAFHR